MDSFRYRSPIWAVRPAPWAQDYQAQGYGIMKITRSQLNQLIREALGAQNDLDDDEAEEDEVEEQSSVAGYMEPLGYGSPAKRKKRRNDTIRAIAAAFGGASVDE